MISHQHRLIFVHVPKCAGMAVEAALGGLPVAQRTEQHFSAAQIRATHPDLWERYTAFTVVRHPVLRALSYVRFFRRFDAVWRRHLAEVPDTVLLRDLLMSTNGLTQHTPSSMLSGTERVLRLEELAETWPDFAREFGLPLELPQRNRAPERTRATDLDDVTALMIAALFPADHHRFGYEPCPTPLDSLPLESQGPVWWARLRAWSLQHKEASTTEQRERAHEALEDWVRALPTDGWRAVWREVTAEHPPVFDGHEGLITWASHRHDDVNRQLGKPLWDAWDA